MTDYTDELRHIEREAREQGEADCRNVLAYGEAIGHHANCQCAACAIARRNEIIKKLAGAIDELDSMGEWVWSEADDKTLLSIYLTEDHHTELMDLMDKARLFLA